MTRFLSHAVLCFIPLALLCTPAHGQDLPAVTTTPPFQGFQLPTELGTMHYALNFGERVRTGYYGTGGNVWTTDFSGNLGYLSSSETRPLNIVYSGGYLYNTGGVASSIFQNLTISQSFNSRLWTTHISDAVNYLPEAASSGLSGLPGLGDVGVTAPPVGDNGGQDILSRTGQRISNQANLDVERHLTGSTSLQVGGGYFIERFLDGGSDSLDGDSFDVQAGINHRIDALNKVEGTYTFSRFSYENEDFTISTQKITVGYSRQVNRKLSLHATIGPQFVSEAGSPLASSSVNLSVDAGMVYTGEQYDYSANYTRGVRSGSGIVQGAFVDSVFGEGGRKLGEYMHLSVSGGYTHNASIGNLASGAPTTQQTDFQTVVGNVQFSRVLSRNFNAFLNYSVQHQDSPTVAASTNAFSGTSQTYGFGITYSPRPLHLGHK